MKINIDNFNPNAMRAKLLVMLRSMPNITEVSNDEYRKAARQLCETHFEPNDKMELVALNFISLSLGNNNTCFSHFLNL